MEKIIIFCTIILIVIMHYFDFIKKTTNIKRILINDEDAFNLLKTYDNDYYDSLSDNNYYRTISYDKFNEKVNSNYFYSYEHNSYVKVVDKKFSLSILINSFENIDRYSFRIVTSSKKVCYLPEKNIQEICLINDVSFLYRSY